MTLQQLKKEIEELKESINPRTSQLDILKIKEELKAKLNQIRERMQELGELPELITQETEELIKEIHESLDERIKNHYFQRWVKCF